MNCFVLFDVSSVYFVAVPNKDLSRRAHMCRDIRILHCRPLRRTSLPLIVEQPGLDSVLAWSLTLRLTRIG